MKTVQELINTLELDCVHNAPIYARDQKGNRFKILCTSEGGPCGTSVVLELEAEEK